MKTRLLATSLLTLTSGLAQTPYFEIPGNRAGMRTSQVSGAGDINGDGFSDLLVGSPLDAVQRPDGGSVRVVSGRDGRILRTHYGGGMGQFGGRVANLGDLNRDGYDDYGVSSINDGTVAPGRGCGARVLGARWKLAGHGVRARSERLLRLVPERGR